MPRYLKHKTARSEKYKQWLKTQPCCNCGQKANDYLSVVPAHQNLEGGFMGGKSNDFHALPLCVECHYWEHQAPKTFWRWTDKKKIVIDCLVKFIENEGKG